MSMLAPGQFDEWDTAVPDWADRIRVGKSLFPKLPLHDAYSKKALEIFKSLRNPDLPGFPTFGETCDEWVFDLVSVIFGSYDPDVKKRYLREFFVMIPKKNGKTAISAAIIVTACILNLSPEAQFVMVAPTIKLANNAFNTACGIIRRTATITALFSEPSASQRIVRLLNKDIPSEISIVAADTEVVTGIKNATVLIDETHVFASKPSAEAVFTEIRGSQSHPGNKHFLLQITTQSKKPPVGVYRSELTTARRVRDGKIKKPMLALIYELPVDMIKNGGWKDEDTWSLVNPHLGRSVDLDFLRDQVSTAEDAGEEKLAMVASQYFNVEIGTSQGDDGWRAQAYWDNSCEHFGSVGLDLLHEFIEQVDVVTFGADGGGDDDLCGAVALGKNFSTGRTLIWGRAWCQPEVLKLRKSIAPALSTFASDGDLVICSEAFQHVAEIVEIVSILHESGKMPEEGAVGLDFAGLPEILTELQLAGYDYPFVSAVKQGWDLQTAIKSIPLQLKAGNWRHMNQPLVAWSVGNARVETKRSNQYITKELAGAAKIDVVIGMLNAAQLMNRNPQPLGRGLDDFLNNPVMVA